MLVADGAMLLLPAMLLLGVALTNMPPVTMALDELAAFALLTYCIREGAPDAVDGLMTMAMPASVVSLCAQQKRKKMTDRARSACQRGSTPRSCCC